MKKENIFLGFQESIQYLKILNNRGIMNCCPLSNLKELKMACAQYSPTVPLTQAIIEALGNQNLPPNDWKQVARACLSGGDYLLWKSEFAEQCRITADINR